MGPWIGHDILRLSTPVSPTGLWRFSRLLAFIPEEVRLIQGGFGKSSQEQCFAGAEREKLSTTLFAMCMGRQGALSSPVAIT